MTTRELPLRSEVISAEDAADLVGRFAVEERQSADFLALLHRCRHILEPLTPQELVTAAVRLLKYNYSHKCGI